MGSLHLNYPAFVRQLLIIFQSRIGSSIKELGDLDLSYTLHSANSSRIDAVRANFIDGLADGLFGVTSYGLFSGCKFHFVLSSNSPGESGVAHMVTFLPIWSMPGVENDFAVSCYAPARWTQPRCRTSVLNF